MLFTFSDEMLFTLTTLKIGK